MIIKTDIAVMGCRVCLEVNEAQHSISPIQHAYNHAMNAQRTLERTLSEGMKSMGVNMMASTEIELRVCK